MPNKKDNSVFIRNFTFGVEDSLVSTVGLLAGIAVAGVEQKTIIITGLVLIFVEAFSMAVGSLISERSVEEYKHRKINLSAPIHGSVVMFVSYIVAGLVPLLPYMLWFNNGAVLWSVVLSLFALFILGAGSGKLYGARPWRDGIFTLSLGAIAIIVGMLVGQLAERI